MRTRFLAGHGAAMVLALVAVAAFGQDAPSELTVAEMAFGTGFDYETRSLTGEAITFPAGVEVIWCRTRIDGADDPAAVTHVWYRDGKTVAKVELAVKSPMYRTASSKKLLADWTGNWEVKVLDGAGTVLRSASFTVE